MIPLSTVAEIKRLLAAPGMSQRKVALITGVSRASVGAIASGKRPDYPDRQAVDDSGEPDKGPQVWCTGCAHNVHLIRGQCLLCQQNGTPRTYRETRVANPATVASEAPRDHPVHIDTDEDVEGEPIEDDEDLGRISSPIDLHTKPTNYF